MDSSMIPKILDHLNLQENSVACIYNYGSWVYGTNKPTSDRDLMIVTRSPAKPPITFYSDSEYFHDFQLYPLWNQFDVCVHSVENFEKLLEKSYLLAVECVFLPDEFKIKEEIDFQRVYLEKFYDPIRLKKVAFYENYAAISLFRWKNRILLSPHDNNWYQVNESSRTRLIKKVFHGFRYLDVVQQLIESRSIFDFRRVSHVLQQVEDIFLNQPNGFLNRMIKFVEEHSDELKSRLDELVPMKKVKGVFEAHVTFECSHRTEEVIERLNKTCENSKFKLIFIELNTKTKGGQNYQLMTSSHHCGEYPTIIKQIEDEVNEKFRDFNIIRIKIESLASNECIPERKIDKILFWDKETNYFEFHYKILIKSNASDDPLNAVQHMCKGFREVRLHVSRNAFRKLDNSQLHSTITARLFDVGYHEALRTNERIIAHLIRWNYRPLEVEKQFVVYDSFMGIDQDWA